MATVDPSPAPMLEAPVFFIHVMKTGGTTIRHHLRENVGARAVFPDRDLDADLGAANTSIGNLRSLGPDRRDAVRAWCGHLPYHLVDLIGARTTITVLRDPVERAISQIRQHQVNHHPDWTASQIYYDLGFALGTRQHQLRMFSMTGDDPVDTVFDWIDATADRLERAKENLARVDIIGFTDRFSELEDELRARLGWRVDPGRHRNRSRVDLDIPPELREQIAVEHRQEVELVEFARQLVADRRRRAGRPEPGSGSGIG